MKKKSKNILQVIISLIIISIGILTIYNKFFKIQNAFDEMYYTRVRNSYFWFGGNRSTWFDNMDELKAIPRDNELTSTQDGIFEENYMSEYLDENQEISIVFNKERKEILFICYLTFPANEDNSYKDIVSLKYSYNLKNRTLQKKNIILLKHESSNDSVSKVSNEDFDINDFLKARDITYEDLAKKQEWFLYEKFLPDWFAANSGNSKYSLDDLGKVKVESEQN